ncbi:MAG: electron transport complex subunit RsxG [Magnetovibrionaceae bacterium]
MTEEAKPQDEKKEPEAGAEEAKAKPGLRDKLVYPAIMLGVFSLAAASALAVGDGVTRDTIALRMAEDLQASLSQVIPTDHHDNDLLADAMAVGSQDAGQKTVYRATKEGELTALAFQSSGFGYAGEILVLMAVQPNGEVLGVRVLKHAETPGLGDKIEIERDNWILAFDGRSLENLARDKWAVKKDGGIFDQFSGATITPRAVVSAVRDGLDFFSANKETLLAPPPAVVGKAEEGTEQ